MITHATDGEHYREHVDALRQGKRTGIMRIMRAGMPETCPQYICMDALNEQWAQRNHGQSLHRLNERGGLSPSEAAAIIERRSWKKMSDYAAIEAIKSFAFTVSETVSHE